MSKFGSHDDPNTGGRKQYKSPELKAYSTPKLTTFGDLRDLAKGQAAYSAAEGAYQDFPQAS